MLPHTFFFLQEIWNEWHLCFMRCCKIELSFQGPDQPCGVGLEPKRSEGGAKRCGYRLQIPDAAVTEGEPWDPTGAVTTNSISLSFCFLV